MKEKMFVKGRKVGNPEKSSENSIERRKFASRSSENNEKS